MPIDIMYVLHFGQNKRATSLKFIPPQNSCEVRTIQISTLPQFNHASANFCIATYGLT